MVLALPASFFTVFCFEKILDRTESWLLDKADGEGKSLAQIKTLPELINEFGFTFVRIKEGGHNHNTPF